MILYIDIREVVRRSERIKTKPQSYFDRKTYTFVDAEDVKDPQEEPYERYLPALKVDEEKLEDEYIASWNHKKLQQEYENAPHGFSDFVECQGLWNDWRRFYYKRVSEMAVAWCEKHHIKYMINDQEAFF